jgi:hypothetical protein
MVTYEKIGMINVESRWSFLYTDGNKYYTMIDVTPFRQERMSIDKGLIHLYDVFFF